MAEVYEEVEVELEESDDDFQYEEVEIEDEEDDLGDDIMIEDLNAAMRSLQALGRAPGAEPGVAAGGQQERPGEVTKHPEVIDDFIRNFLVKVGFRCTLGLSHHL